MGHYLSNKSSDFLKIIKPLYSEVFFIPIHFLGRMGITGILTWDFRQIPLLIGYLMYFLWLLQKLRRFRLLNVHSLLYIGVWMTLFYILYNRDEVRFIVLFYILFPFGSVYFIVWSFFVLSFLTDLVICQISRHFIFKIPFIL